MVDKQGDENGSQAFKMGFLGDGCHSLSTEGKGNQVGKKNGFSFEMLLLYNRQVFASWSCSSIPWVTGQAGEAQRFSSS